MDKSNPESMQRKTREKLRLEREERIRQFPTAQKEYWWNRFRARVMQFIVSFGVTLEDAEELLGETFDYSLSAADEEMPEGEFLSLWFSNAHKRTMSCLKQRTRHDRHNRLYAQTIADYMAPGIPQASGRVADFEDQDLRNCLTRLGERERFVLMRRYGLDGDQISQKDLGRAMGFSNGSNVSHIEDKAILDLARCLILKSSAILVLNFPPVDDSRVRMQVRCGTVSSAEVASKRICEKTSKPCETILVISLWDRDQVKYVSNLEKGSKELEYKDTSGLPLTLTPNTLLLWIKHPDVPIGKGHSYSLEATDQLGNVISQHSFDGSADWGMPLQVHFDQAISHNSMTLSLSYERDAAIKKEDNKCVFYLTIKL